MAKTLSCDDLSLKLWHGGDIHPLRSARPSIPIKQEYLDSVMLFMAVLAKWKVLCTHYIQFANDVEGSVFRAQQSSWVNNVAVGGRVGGWLKRGSFKSTQRCLRCISSIHPIISLPPDPSRNQTLTSQPLVQFKYWCYNWGIMVGVWINSYQLWA